MRKISLAILGIFFSLLSSFAQTASDSLYKPKKLSLEEVNFVSSYYHQDGPNAAVTGGRGSEKLTDFSNLIELRVNKTDLKQRLHTFNLNMGIDIYTSASSDSIDPHTISSPSSSETRYYGTLGYTMRNEKKRYSLGLIGYASTEYDYTSLAPGIVFTKFSKDNNRELSVKLQTFLDKRQIILPIELRNKPGIMPDKSNRNSFNSSITYSSIINERMQFSLLLDPSYQTGLLSTPFNRVYFTDKTLRIEKLPDTRAKLPVGLKLNYFFGDRIIFRSFYRYYIDSWGLKAHTASLEIPYKISPFFSISPYYRFSAQSAAKYFAGYAQHQNTEEFYTSDYDISKFTSQFLGLNLRFTSPGGIMGINKWNTIELRYGYYSRSTGLHSNIITLAAKFK